MEKLWQFSRDHSKPAFSKKVQRGDQRNFFKNRPKRCPRLRGLKALWRKWHYPLISMHLKCKDWKRLCVNSGSKRAQMAKLWQFKQRHPKPAFSEKVHRGTSYITFRKWPVLSSRTCLKLQLCRLSLLCQLCTLFTRSAVNIAHTTRSVVYII